MANIHTVLATQYRGQPAQISVVRNDGNCWGRLVLADGTQLDVVPDDDVYDETDEACAALFDRLVKADQVSDPLTTWSVDWNRSLPPSPASA